MVANPWDRILAALGFAHTKPLSEGQRYVPWHGRSGHHPRNVPKHRPIKKEWYKGGKWATCTNT